MDFIALPQLTVLEVFGKDAARVVNNVCTAPILQLLPGDGCEAFITEVRGRTLGHLCVYRASDSLRLIGAPNQTEVVAAHLDRYTIREDARCEDRSGDWKGLLADRETLAAVAPDFQSGTPLTLQSLPWQALNCGGSEDQSNASSDAEGAILFTVPWTGDGRVLIAGPTAVIDDLSNQLCERGANVFEEPAFHTARVSNRFPWFGIDMDNSNLPQEADRDPLAISFTKGCYLGQETVARLDALGQVQRKIVLWQLDSPQCPLPGTELTSEGRVVGRLTTVVANPAGDGFLALGFARRSHFEAGATAEGKLGDGSAIKAVVV
jgi:tRNA-modifying protein YgfZ